MSDNNSPVFPKLTARDLMIPLESYPSIHESANLAEAIATFSGSRIDRKGTLSLPRILLVFSDQEKLTGVVRRRDIICGLLPHYMTKQEEAHPESNYEVEHTTHVDLTELLKDIEHKVLSTNAEASVTTIMHEISVMVDADDELLDLIAKTARTRSHILPVMEDDHVIGVVRTIELLNQVRRALKL